MIYFGQSLKADINFEIEWKKLYKIDKLWLQMWKAKPCAELEMFNFEKQKQMSPICVWNQFTYIL